jgi:DNA-binding transcriptional regulator YdaS (Cro superfamily)
VTSAFMLGFLVLGAALAWPIYQNIFFVVSVGSAVVLGGLIAWLRISRGWGLVTTALIAAGAYLVLSLPLTNPQALGSPATLLRGWLESVSGLVLSWKQLVTIDLPVGTYHALLVPAFVTFYIATLLAVSILWKSNKQSALALFPLIGVSIFGLAFGGSTVAAAMSVAGTTVPISAGVAAGVALLVLSISFLSWSTSNVRRAGMLVVSSTTARRATARSRILRRSFGALGVVLVAAVIGSLLLNAVGIASTRQVLRSAVDPMQLIRSQLSPLSSYRGYFEDPTLLTKQLLTFTSDSKTPANIRLAVMPYFNGQVYSITPPEGTTDDASMYSRVPTDLDSTTGSNVTSTTKIAVTGLTGIWAPVPSNMKSIEFTGAQSGTFTDSFFFNRSSGAGVLIPGPSTGATYSVTAYDANDVEAIKELSSGGAAPKVAKELVPDSMITWIEKQKVDGTSGAGFKELVDRLRARGYLSHSLQSPVAPAGEQTWKSLLAGYSAFEPSLAGHSVGRLAKMFDALNQRQTNTGSTDNADLVAAVGDDEQFAAAVALMASDLGYLSRVVVGFRASAPADNAYAIESCAKGVCTGANLTAWVEVAGTNGKWVTFDVTPQFKNKISPKSQNRQDPKNETAVTEDAATVLPPAKANPANGATKAKDQGFVLDLTWLVEVLKIVGTFALIAGILASPFVLVIGAKVRRRRERREALDPSVSILGAWEEFVDTSVDAGSPLPKRQTRSELANLFARSEGSVLAVYADEAAFAPYEPDAETVQKSWELVDEQRRELRESNSRWKNLVHLMSLRSFVRYIQPKEQIRRIQGAFAFASEGTSDDAPTVWAFLVFVGRQAKKLALELYEKMRERLKRK